jgi:hypothetical protein
LIARNALLDQIQYNKVKREAERKAELQMGQLMINNAFESLIGES